MTTGKKDDAGKPRMDLIPPETLTALGVVFDYGARKYAPRNWELGIDRGRLYAAALRHLAAWAAREEVDEESGLPHLDHALTCVAMLQASHVRGIGADTRGPPSRLDEMLRRQGEVDIPTSGIPDPDAAVYEANRRRGERMKEQDDKVAAPMDRAHGADCPICYHRLSVHRRHPHPGGGVVIGCLACGCRERRDSLLGYQLSVPEGDPDVDDAKPGTDLDSHFRKAFDAEMAAARAKLAKDAPAPIFATPPGPGEMRRVMENYTDPDEPRTPWEELKPAIEMVAANPPTRIGPPDRDRHGPIVPAGTSKLIEPDVWCETCGHPKGDHVISLVAGTEERHVRCVRCPCEDRGGDETFLHHWKLARYVETPITVDGMTAGAIAAAIKIRHDHRDPTLRHAVREDGRHEPWCGGCAEKWGPVPADTPRADVGGGS